LRARRIALVFALVACALALRAGDARAEGLHDEAERLAAAWRAVGASVVIDKPRFLQEEVDRDQHLVVALPDLPEGECTTVVLLGARGLGFHVRLAEEGSDEPNVKRIPAAAGALSIERCGTPLPPRLVVASDSGRGAFETVVARSSQPVPPVRVVLPERTGASLLPTNEPGGLPALPSPDKRAEVAEARARRDGATVNQRTTWTTGSDRSGSGDMTLEIGCHEIQLFAVDPRVLHPGLRGRLDLDAEMRDETGDRLLGRDRSDAPDATLVKCVGEATRVEVVFAGAPSGSPVLATHASWALPDHLPPLWGPAAQARIAHVLLARHVPALRQDPVLLAQGGYGVTPVPMPLEPGGCYLAVVTLAKETARSVGLRIRVGATDVGDDRGIDDDGAAVAFCAGDTSRALGLVEARGAMLLGWGLALYRLQSSVWGEPQ
jgi:hypothetical protein